MVSPKNRAQSAGTAAAEQRTETEEPHSKRPELHQSTSFRRGTMFGTYTQQEADALRERNIATESGDHVSSDTTPVASLPHGIRRYQSAVDLTASSDSSANEFPADEEDRLIAGKASLKLLKVGPFGA